jgi:hypothetical protein
MGQTNRERTTSLTSARECAACHGVLINPFGYPFERYGADGRYRELDNGVAVRADAELSIDGELVPVSSVEDLLQAVAESHGGHACYVSQWHQYVHARGLAEQDGPLIARLARHSRTGQISVKDLLVDLVTAPSFTARAKEIP